MEEAAVTPSIERRPEPADPIFPGSPLSRAFRQTASALAMASAQTGGFVEQFTGAPSVPTPFSSPNWDIHAHDINPAHWNSLDPMTAEHGDDCAPPPATHTLSGVYANAVFQCRDHIMTGING